MCLWEVIIVSSFALVIFLGNNKIVFLPIKRILTVLGVFIGMSIPEILLAFQCSLGTNWSYIPLEYVTKKIGFLQSHYNSYILSKSMTILSAR